MIDIFMVSVTAIATVVVVLTPFAILGAVGAFRRRRLIAKVDGTTALIRKTTEDLVSLVIECEPMNAELTDEITARVKRAAADISGVYPHRPELRP